MADGSKNPTQGRVQATGSAASPRLRSEEMVDRGLRLYAHGDLAGALAEWRRALEVDRTNDRGRNYLSYVEDHYEILSEKFRAARRRRPDSEPAIEIEADDPMDDIDPYESLVLEEVGEAAVPVSRDPLGAGSALPAGKQGAGRKPWGTRRSRDSEEAWPADESWQDAPRQEAIEMAFDANALDDLDEIGEASEADTEELDRPPILDTGSDEGDVLEMVAEAAADDAAAADEPRADGHEPGSGEITLPARRRHRAEGSVRRDPGNASTRSGLGSRLQERGDPQLDLSDFTARATLTDQEAREEEAWADGTPVTDPGPALAAMRDEELREVRVTFRRPSRAMPALTREPRRSLLDRPPTAPGGPSRPPVPTAPPIVSPIDDSVEEIGTAFRPVDDEEDEDSVTGDVSALAVAAEDVAEDELADESLLADELADGSDDADEVDEPDEIDELEDLDDAADRDALDSYDEVDKEVADEDDEDERTVERRRAPAQFLAGRDLGLIGVEDAAQSLSDDLLLFGDEEGEPFRLCPRPREQAAPVEPARPDSEESHGREGASPRHARAHSAISIELVSSELMAELDRAVAGTHQAAEDLVRERVTWLIERAERENREGRHASAVMAVDLALDENPESAVAQKLIHTHRDLFLSVYGNYLGDMTAVPGLAHPMSAIPLHELDHRAAFLLSRVDGVLSLEDVLDVSGMARLEAVRHLSRLVLRGFLEIR